MSSQLRACRRRPSDCCPGVDSLNWQELRLVKEMEWNLQIRCWVGLQRTTDAARMWHNETIVDPLRPWLRLLAAQNAPRTSTTPSLRCSACPCRMPNTGPDRLQPFRLDPGRLQVSLPSRPKTLHPAVNPLPPVLHSPATILVITDN